MGDDDEEENRLEIARRVARFYYDEPTSLNLQRMMFRVCALYPDELAILQAEFHPEAEWRRAQSEIEGQRKR